MFSNTLATILHGKGWKEYGKKKMCWCFGWKKFCEARKPELQNLLKQIFLIETLFGSKKTLKPWTETLCTMIWAALLRSTRNSSMKLNSVQYPWNWILYTLKMNTTCILLDRRRGFGSPFLFKIFVNRYTGQELFLFFSFSGFFRTSPRKKRKEYIKYVRIWKSVLVNFDSSSRSMEISRAAQLHGIRRKRPFGHHSERFNYAAGMSFIFFFLC